MDQSPQRNLRLALHRFLDLCRDARARDLNPEVRTWLSKVELSAWGCLAQYRHAELAQQDRLLAHCLRLEDKTRRLTGIFLPGDPRADEARLQAERAPRRHSKTAAGVRALATVLLRPWDVRVPRGEARTA
jgi:hypothetical protein